MKLFILMVSLSFSLPIMALDQTACSRLLNDGLYKKYQYGGVDQPLTKATKKHGVSKGSSATSTEASTALLDPKYWSNVSTSETQSTSSTGECNLFGLNQLKEQRELYFLQNRDELVAEISQGGGEHLKVLAAYSLCDQDKTNLFAQNLKGKTALFLQTKKGFGKVIDQSVFSAHELQGVCYIYN